MTRGNAVLTSKPAWLDTEAWEAFVEMRKAKGRRAPFTFAAAKRIVYELDRLRSQGYPPTEVLWQSIVNGWSGVFPAEKLKETKRDNHSDWLEKYKANMQASQSPQAKQAAEEAMRRIRRH